MKSHSPTLEGFRVMFRRPSLGLAEIAWRWSFGLAAVSLLLFCFVEYLDTLPVSSGDMLLLRSRHPFLISQAFAHIFRGSGFRLVEGMILVALALAVAWIVLGSLGRAVTIRALLEHFAKGTAAEAESAQPFWRRRSEGWRLRSLFGLHFFRVAVTLAAAVGCMGAMLVAGWASTPADPSPGSVMLIFLMLIMLVGLAWSGVNWFLSLAAIFVVRDGRDTFGALSAAGDLCRVRTGSVLAVGTWFGTGHVVAFVVATSVVAFPLAFAAVLPAGVVLGGVLLVTMLYFAVVDFLYVGRLAAYLAILEMPKAPITVPPIQVPPPESPQLQSRVDPNELILSDI